MLLQTVQWDTSYALRHLRKSPGFAFITAHPILHGARGHMAAGKARLETRSNAGAAHRITPGKENTAMGSFIRYLCYGLRQLRKSPGFTLSAVLPLAFGIGPLPPFSPSSKASCSVP